MRFFFTYCAAIIFILLNTAILHSSPTSSFTLTDKDKIESTDLDKNIAGLILFPTAYRQNETTGPAIDFALTNIIGELTGSRKTSDKREYTNPILMSLVTLSAKWAVLADTGKIPALSAGAMFSLALDLGNKLDSELDYKDYPRPSSAPAFFINLGKKIINNNTRLSLGYVFGGYSKIFSNLAPYYYAEKANIVYSGIDLNAGKAKMYLEIVKPMETVQNPLIVNLNLKLRKIPILVFSFINTNQGNSILAIINIRVPVYPPFEDADVEKQQQKEREKKQFENWQERIKTINLN